LRVSEEKRKGESTPFVREKKSGIELGSGTGNNPDRNFEKGKKKKSIIALKPQGRGDWTAVAGPITIRRSGGRRRKGESGVTTFSSEEKKKKRGGQSAVPFSLKLPEPCGGGAKKKKKEGRGGATEFRLTGREEKKKGSELVPCTPGATWRRKKKRGFQTERGGKNTKTSCLHPVSKTGGPRPGRQRKGERVSRMPNF